jgi:hypothetical protein
VIRTEGVAAAVTYSGFPHSGGLIHLFVGGRELYGSKLIDTDDLDIYGIFLESHRRWLSDSKL